MYPYIRYLQVPLIVLYGLLFHQIGWFSLFLKKYAYYIQYWWKNFICRQDVSLRRPFCFDLHESTFKIIRKFLEKYGGKFEENNFSCFESQRLVFTEQWCFCLFIHRHKYWNCFEFCSEHEYFITLCVELLTSHLILTNSGLSSNISLNSVSGITIRQLLIK